MTLHINDKLKPYFNANKPLFDQLMALSGDVYRDQEGRKTQRVKIGDDTYFIKQHRGVGAKEFFKNILSLRLPTVSARNEWQAISQLKKLGINVPEIYAYGIRGKNPAKLESFVLMQDIKPTVSLEELCAKWKETPPNMKFKHELIKKVAEIARVMHSNGINHRDFYLCHFLLDVSKGHELTHDDINLSLIDLHRAQIREYTPIRWVIKDLAGLYFSAIDAGLTKHDCLRFIRHYSGTSLDKILSHEQRRKLWMRVKERGDQLYRDHAK